MRYIVTAVVTNEFSIELSAKDEDMAREKAERLWDKIHPVEIDHINTGQFDHQEEKVYFDIQEV